MRLGIDKESYIYVVRCPLLPPLLPPTIHPKFSSIPQNFKSIHTLQTLSTKPKQTASLLMSSFQDYIDQMIQIKRTSWRDRTRVEQADLVLSKLQWPS